MVIVNRRYLVLNSTAVGSFPHSTLSFATHHASSSHHAIKKESATTPIWIVYDCSCRQPPHYPCLNDCLEVWPPFLIDFCRLLLRFQTYNITIVTDVDKAFLQVQLHEVDRKFTLFFWFSETDNPESNLRFTSFELYCLAVLVHPLYYMRLCIATSAMSTLPFLMM